MACCSISTTVNLGQDDWTYLGLRDVVVFFARHPPEQAVHRRQQLVAGGDGLGLAAAGQQDQWNDG